MVAITAVQPGADASEMEQTVAKPIEEIVQGLEDVKEIVSTSVDGSSVIRAEFDWSGDPDKYFNDTVREITAIRSRLPAELARLDFKKMRTTNASVLQFALVSETASWRRMEKYSRDISEALSRYADVRESEVHGLSQPEVTVAINAARLAELRIPASAIADAVRLGGSDVSSGAVVSGTRRFNVEAGGAFKDIDAVRSLPLRTNDGSLVRVGDVADVNWGAGEPDADPVPVSRIHPLRGSSTAGHRPHRGPVPRLAGVRARRQGLSTGAGAGAIHGANGAGGGPE